MNRFCAVRWVVVACLLSGCGPNSSDVTQYDAAPSDQTRVPGDSLPMGTISFFRAPSCPDGWSGYATGAGRLLVPIVGATLGGKTQGAALTDAEDRGHVHSLAGMVTLADVSYAGIGGCCNNGVAASGSVSYSSGADKSSAGLPYVQLLVCHKDVAAVAGALPIPRGTLAFVDTTNCPDGWAQATTPQGRHLVGLPAHGTPGAAFGGAPLGTQEQRTHAHAYSTMLNTASHGIALASGCCASGYAQNASYPISGTTDGADVGLPYVQLLQCEKM
jgi:hypothetical protein